MRRNYLKAGLLTLISSVTLTFAITAATNEGWHKQGQQPREATFKKAVMTPQTQYLRSKGLLNAGNPDLRPIIDGTQNAPIKQRPAVSKIARTQETPRGNIFAVVPRYLGQNYTYEAFMAKVDLNAGLFTSPIFYNEAFSPYTGSDFTFQTNVYRKGHVYCPYQELSMVENTSNYVWKVVDIETGETVGEVNFGSELDGAPYTLTYDEKKDLFYGLALGNGTGNQFCIYDPAKFKYDGSICTDAIEYIGNATVNGNYFSAIAYSPLDENIYGFDQYNEVYQFTINDSNPNFLKVEADLIGYLEYNNTLCEDGVTTPMVWSPMDERFVTTFADNSIKKNVLLYIDPLTWSVYTGQAITSDLNPYIASLVCSDEFADANAPELAPVLDVEFLGNNVKGSVSFTTPQYTYYGIEIGSAKLDVTLKMDDNVIFEGQMGANESKTIDVTVSEGPHTVTLVTAIDGMPSPVKSKAFFAGNDTPLAPTNLALDLARLTWDAPGAVGVQGGYVDVNVLEYDVYVDGVQQNTTPIEDTEFTLRKPANMKRANIEVVATANGKTSRRASLSGVIGQALKTPLAFAPTKEQFNLFTVLNINDDNQYWYPTNINEDDGQGNTISYPAAVFNIGYFQDANDWLIFPAINFADPKEMHNLSFEFASPGINDTSEESFAIYIAQRPTPEALQNGTVIYKRDLYTKSMQQLWDALSFNFAVEQPGDYYIGIHCYSSKDNNSAGMYLRNFEVKTLNGQTSAAPGDSERITVTPGDHGYQYATFEIIAATKDMAGNALDPDKAITYKVVCEQTRESAEVMAKPGEKVSVECNATGKDGYVDFIITPSNEFGSGYSRVRRVYVGIDTPLAPTNIKGVPYDDNLGMTITWDAPGDMGVNGGYVDVSRLTYDIYTRSGVNYFKVGSTENLSTKFEVTNPTPDDYYVGPVAVNEAGQSVGSMFVQEQLGKPFDTPIKEFFNTSGFTLNPYTFMTTGQYAASTWENTGMVQAFGDKFQGAQCQQGALFSYSTFGHTETMLNFPKISTLGMHRANMSVRFWDFDEVPEIRILARYPGHLDRTVIETITPNAPAKGQWNEYVFSLPQALLNQPWVQLSLAASLTGSENEYLVIDTWAVYPDCEYDLGITSFTGTSEAALGDKLTYRCTVTSSGTEPVSGVLNIELVDEDGKVYATDQTNISNLTSLAVSERNVTFELNGDYSNVSKLTARATVVADQDELDNNNVREIAVNIKSTQIPVVSDLAATTGEKGVAFTWSTPTSTYGDFDNFEYHPAFLNTDKIGDWQNIDADGLKPANFESGSLQIKWDGSDQPSAWTVVDAEALNLQSDPRAYAHSGKQYLMARSAEVPDGADARQYQSSDWLISPRIQGGSVLSFWVNTLSADTEYFEIWYSTTGTELGTISALRPNNCGDFQGRTPKSKSGNDTWEPITYKIPNNAKYVAIRFCSYDGLAVFIDDLSITPVEMHTGTADHYALYRSDNNAPFKKVADDIKGNSYIDTTYPDSNANYHLVCVSEIDGKMIEGPKSNNVFIQSSSVANVNAETAIRGGQHEVVLIGFEGENVEIFTTDGKIAYNTAVRAQQAHFGLEPGIYLVRVAGRQTKVVVK